MKIAILGYGVEGKSAEKFLKSLIRNRIAKWQIEIRDVKKQGKNYLKNLDKFNAIIRSPGVPYLSPEIQKARKKGVEITSATKLFFQNAKGVLIGVTGTKGKGTTATLLYKILKASHLAVKPPSKKNIHLIGNMGVPMLEELPKLKKNSISILELSSFQLQDLNVSPHIAVILDVSPDHLNYHKSFEEYLNAKIRIVANQTVNNAKRGAEPNVFYFPDNKYSKLIASKSRGKKTPVFIDSGHASEKYSGRYLKIPGRHNLKNAAMAASVARALGVKNEIIIKTIKNFKGLPHRLEFVRKKNCVKFYNDSASTNPAATIAALGAFDAPKILIAGGAGKNLDYCLMGRAIKKSNVRAVMLYGQNKKEIGRVIHGAESQNNKIFFADTLQSAVKSAFYNAKKGDVVILSPASASFDMFSGYEERGDIFKSLVKKL